MTDNLRQEAARHLPALADEIGSFTNADYARRRMAQCAAIVQCMNEQERYIHTLLAEKEEITKKYLELLEGYQRLVYLCESYGIAHVPVGRDTYLTSEKLAEVRATFPNEKLDNLSDKVYDWVLLGDLEKIFESNPTPENRERLAKILDEMEEIAASFKIG